MAKLADAQKSSDEKTESAKSLSGELTDLELKQKSIDDKIKKFEKDLYGGKIVNSREVENINKEIAMLKRQRGESDVRVLELWELVPPAKAEAEAAQKAVEGLKAELQEFQKGVRAQQMKMEQEFKRLSGERAAVQADVPPSLIARYDAIRNRYGGIGMSRIQKNKTCGMCGTSLPTKTIEDVKEDRMITCEDCHRILYYSESIL